MKTRIKLEMVREFEERAESLGHRSLVKDARKFAEDLGVNLHLKHPEPVCAVNSGEIIPSYRVKVVLKECVEEKLERELRGLEWQGKLLIERKSDSQLCKNGCFSWLSKWKSCPSYTIAGAFEIYEQLLPTKLYFSKKTHELFWGCEVQAVWSCPRKCPAHPGRVYCTSSEQVFV